MVNAMSALDAVTWVPETRMVNDMSALDADAAGGRQQRKLTKTECSIAHI